MASAVADGLEVATLQGSTVTFSIVDGMPMINGANIITTDIVASNGVIHVIDTVILPPEPVAKTALATAAPGCALRRSRQCFALTRIEQILGFKPDLEVLCVLCDLYGSWG